MNTQDNSNRGSGSAEHDLIARYFRPLAKSTPGAFQLMDDAASLEIDPGADLVVTSDALVAGVHFFADDAPADIAFKALGVNVSDLAAKAACPLAYSLSLVLPRGIEENWMSGFASGLAEGQAEFGIGMSGGDTVVSSGGPLTISITAFGTVPHGKMILRSGARAGDALYVTGTIGDAALGLKLRFPGTGSESWPLSEADRRFLMQRYLRPQPRIALRSALLGHASAAMDISDGLAIDASRLCQASGLSGRIEAGKVPLSSAAQTLVPTGPVIMETILTGGDDYEILAAVPPVAEDAFMAAGAVAGVLVTRFGSLIDGDGSTSIIAPNGERLALKTLGYDHFSG
jgi:thiamine-monophosphate kinase